MLQNESDDHLRAVAIAVSKWAVLGNSVERVGIADEAARTGTLRDFPVVHGVLLVLETHRRVPPHLKEQLEGFVGALDESYFQAYEAAEAGRGKPDSWQPLFSLARAADAVLSACDPDPRRAASEAIYEAWAAMDENTDALKAVVAKALRD